MIELTKKQARAQARAAREALTQTQRDQYSHQICAHIQNLPQFQAARSVLSYMSFGAEADITALLDQYARHKQMLLPLSGRDRRLIIYHYNGEDALLRSAYGILEPNPQRSVPFDDVPDLVLVPGLAFDRRGVRVGYGAGYYDRYLGSLPRRPYLAGVAFACQVFDALEHMVYDVNVDCMITQHGVIPIASEGQA